MERDEWLRAAWRVMVAKKVEPERLVFVDARWERTLPFLSCVLGHVRESECTALCPATVGRTPPCSPAWAHAAWAPAARGQLSRWRAHQPRSVRGLCRRSAHPEPAIGTDRGYGQPHHPQGRAGERTHRRARLRTTLPAALLSRPQPHRRGLQQDKRHLAKSGGQKPGGTDRSDGPRARCDHPSGCAKLFQTLRIPITGATIVTFGVVYHL